MWTVGLAVSVEIVSMCLEGTYSGASNTIDPIWSRSHVSKFSAVRKRKEKRLYCLSTPNVPTCCVVFFYSTWYFRTPDSGSDLYKYSPHVNMWTCGIWGQGVRFLWKPQWTGCCHGKISKRFSQIGFDCQSCQQDTISYLIMKASQRPITYCY